MKKSIIFILLAFFAAYFADAQKRSNSETASLRNSEDKQAIDDLMVRFTYQAMSAEDTLRSKRHRVLKDIEALDIGSKYARFYSLLAEEIDSTSYRYRKNLIESKYKDAYDPLENIRNGEVARYEEIFSGYPDKGTMTVITRFWDKTYSYREPIPSLEWKFINGRDTSILGHRCFFAVAAFRGRQWHAWFTLDIPLPHGPWKLGGLPGLILKAYDEKGYFTYELIGVHKAELGEKVYHYDIPEIKSERQDILRMTEMQWKDPETLASTTSNAEVIIMQYAVIDQVTGKERNATPQEVARMKRYIPQRELE